jgi:sugar lactone lactonase YvrE
MQTNQVLRYDADGNFLGAFATGGAEGMLFPQGIRLGPDGNLYVACLHSGKVYRYQGPNGAQPGNFMDVYSAGMPDDPSNLEFGPDGRLYIRAADKIYRATGIPGTPAQVFVAGGSGGLTGGGRDMAFDAENNLLVAERNTGAVLRYQGPYGASPGAFIDAVVPPGLGGLSAPIGITFDAAGNLYVSSYDQNEVLRYAQSAIATFTVSLSSASTQAVTVNYVTANGTATSGEDYTPASGVLTFAPGQTSRTIFVQTVNDTAIETDQRFDVVLSTPTGAVLTADDTGVGTIIDNDTKFYVVDDAAANRTFEYGAGAGAAGENYLLASGNTTPRGAASTAAGDKVWVVDSNKDVYVYSSAGVLLGSWAAGSIAGNPDVQGIATNGADIWLVDAKGDKVYRYTGAADRISGSQNAASNFGLNKSNTNPKDLVTDGASIWVVDDGTTDKVFKYSLAGAMAGNWTVTGGGGSPTGITLDPSNPSHLWIVDNSTDRVYQYDNAVGRISGSQGISTSFALVSGASGNLNPQGIADPPVSGSRVVEVSDGISSQAEFAMDLSLAAANLRPGRDAALRPAPKLPQHAVVFAPVRALRTVEVEKSELVDDALTDYFREEDEGELSDETEGEPRR